MNNPQGPPQHYPSSHESTHEIYRTPNFSRNESPRYRPPAYGAGRSPPLYHEDTEDDEKARAKARKTTYLRLAGSFLIVVIIALIIAGVIGKIIITKKNEQVSNDLKNTTPTKPVSATHADRMMAFTPTPLISVTPTTFIRSTSTTSCRRNDITPRAVIPETKPPCDIVFFNKDGYARDAQLVGVATRRFEGCLISQASYMGPDGSLRFRCSESCRRTRLDGEPARAEVADDWGSCG
ncbi:unnamed protein product [Clonostachys rosea]|uniref:WSC domain-containing protein n=1 Tax=Bionectria ochroleuca TaxID=29856 RepID=A0ABY6TSP0_BIOOC|nr:unnamed protein product [Clonostachys rosea]